jgi:hypothetical protein
MLETGASRQASGLEAMVMSNLAIWRFGNLKKPAAA